MTDRNETYERLITKLQGFDNLKMSIEWYWALSAQALASAARYKPPGHNSSDLIRPASMISATGQGDSTTNRDYDDHSVIRVDSMTTLGKYKQTIFIWPHKHTNWNHFLNLEPSFRHTTLQIFDRMQTGNLRFCSWLEKAELSWIPGV